MTPLMKARAKYLNKKALVSTGMGSLLFYAHIEEVTKRFGRVDLRIVPVAGTGTCWISSKFVTVCKT